MKSRCTNLRDAAWKYYGGRGIRVCAEWLKSFEAFFAHVGPKPSAEYTLDRIENDGNYEPGNVRWATWGEQARNRRAWTRARKMDRIGKISVETGLSRKAIRYRIDRGWNEEQIRAKPHQLGWVKRTAKKFSD